jgi:hypothetical protein
LQIQCFQMNYYLPQKEATIVASSIALILLLSHGLTSI